MPRELNSRVANKGSNNMNQRKSSLSLYCPDCGSTLWMNREQTQRRTAIDQAKLENGRMAHPAVVGECKNGHQFNVNALRDTRLLREA